MEEEEDLKSVKSKPIGGIDDLSIEDLPPNQTKEEAKKRKFSGCKPYPEGDESIKYDMNDIYTLITTTAIIANTININIIQKYNLLKIGHFQNSNHL